MPYKKQGCVIILARSKFMTTSNICLYESLQPVNRQTTHPQSDKSHEIIRHYAFGSSLTGFIPIPLVDIAGVIAVQRVMLLHLSRHYDVPFSKNATRIILSSLMGGVASKAATPFASSALKLIPGVGTLASGASMATTSAASTYAVGKIFQQHFEKGGTFADFNLDKTKTEFDKRLQEGKQLYQQYKEQAQ